MHYIAFYIYLGHLPGANPNLHFTKQLELKLRILIKLYTIFPLLLKQRNPFSLSICCYSQCNKQYSMQCICTVKRHLGDPILMMFPHESHRDLQRLSKSMFSLQEPSYIVNSSQPSSTVLYKSEKIVQNTSYLYYTYTYITR